MPADNHVIWITTQLRADWSLLEQWSTAPTKDHGHLPAKRGFPH